MQFKIIITIISIIGVSAFGIGLRSSLGYLISNRHYYTFSDQDIGMSLGSALAITSLGVGFILTSIILARHEKIIADI